MKDDGRPDFEFVWAQSATDDTFISRIVGVNFHPRVWRGLFAAAVLAGGATSPDCEWQHERWTQYAKGLADALLAAMEDKAHD